VLAEFNAFNVHYVNEVLDVFLVLFVLFVLFVLWMLAGLLRGRETYLDKLLRTCLGRPSRKRVLQRL